MKAIATVSFCINKRLPLPEQRVKRSSVKAIPKSPQRFIKGLMNPIVHVNLALAKKRDTGAFSGIDVPYSSDGMQALTPISILPVGLVTISVCN
ncbi:hypothetical protein AVEN_18979-1 [Araneus ventricosus]|uniref:Uncharacterized protein n=1 Tax=Araneus ventricosus TaxID=182803 RepID=A0A4Y2JM79_ARAVE|nr:hypothetical protein AVEN_18979-1 [Araneus ventricosus]